MRVKIFRALYLFLTLAVMAAIFWFSHQSGGQSDSVSGGVMQKIISLLDLFGLGEEAKPAVAEALSAILQPAAHFIIFAALGLFFTAFLKTYDISGRKAFIMCAAFCLLYAISDEVHQYFVPQRAFEIFDIAIDFAGSLFGAASALLINYIVKGKYGQKRI